jgi:dTMP kinase
VVPRAETLLLLAARAQHVDEVIEPALAAGRDVVCDRFSGSTLAYQGYGRGLATAELRRLSRWAAAGLEPDLIVLLTVVPEEADRRRTARRAAGGVGPDRIEGAEAAFHARIEAGFLDLAAADPERWTVVDGGGTPDEVAARVTAAVRARR